MYSKEVKHHMKTPQNSPLDLPYNASVSYDYTVPCSSNPERVISAKVDASFFIQDDIIEGSRVKVFGAPAAMAAGNWASGALRGMDINTALSYLTPERLSIELNTPESIIKSQGCEAIARAVYNALMSFIEAPLV